MWDAYGLIMHLSTLILVLMPIAYAQISKFIICTYSLLIMSLLNVQITGITIVSSFVAIDSPWLRNPLTIGLIIVTEFVLIPNEI